MTIPARIPITHAPYDGETTDGLGNRVPAYGTPVTRKVYSIAPRTREQTVTWSTSEVADVDVFAPTFAVDLKDRFVIDGDTYEVVGRTDWNHGFHGWKPGLVIELKRVD